MKDYTMNEVSTELDAVLGLDDVAQEGLFSKPKTADELVTKVQKRVDKLKTVEACDDLLAKMKTEVEKYNACLKGMSAAAKEFAAGTIDKKELAAKIAPFAKELKNSHDILSVGQVAADKKNATDEEIAKLRDFLTGATSLISKKKAELKAAPVAESAMSIESFLNALDDAEIAEEAIGAEAGAAIAVGVYYAALIALVLAIKTPKEKAVAMAKKSKFSKAAKENVKSAKKAAKGRNYAEAIDYYKKAKTNFASIGELIRDIPNTAVTGKINVEGQDSAMSASAVKADAINWVTNKILACDNAIKKITDKQEKHETTSNVNESALLTEALAAFELALESVTVEEVVEEEEDSDIDVALTDELDD